VPMYRLCEEQEAHRASIRGGEGTPKKGRHLLRRLRYSRLHVAVLLVWMGDSGESLGWIVWTEGFYFHFLTLVIQIPNRATVRRRYDIEGDYIGDCAAAFFCSPCELSQESREIDLEERTFGDVRSWSRGQDVNFVS